jgi:AraC-like DNA-binding protein
MSTSVLIARGLLAEVQRRGVDGEALLRRCDLDGSCLTDLCKTLRYRELDVLVREAMIASDDPGLGLAIGSSAPLGMLQLLGQLMLSQRTLREALHILKRYQLLLARGPTFSLVELGATAYFTWDPQSPDGDTRRFAVELTFALATRIGRLFLGTQAQLLGLRLQHEAPEYVVRYRAVFGCPVLFGQESNTLSFPRACLDQPQPYADSTMHTLLSEAADRLLAERGGAATVAERVRSMLRYEHELRDLKLDRVARRIGLNTRTLRRRLGREGVSLSGLVDEARCVRSCSELRRGDSSIKDIAAGAGFSEPSAFYRAFRRWTGLTPLEYVRRHRVRPSDEAPMSLRGESARSAM